MLFSEGLDLEIKVFLQGVDRLSHLLLSFCQNLSYGFTSGTCNKTLYHPCHINQTQIYQPQSWKKCRDVSGAKLGDGPVSESI